MKSLLVLFVLALSASAYALPLAGTNIEVNLAKYDPAPAEAGRFVNVWFDITNRGGDASDNIEFSLIPLYPFSLPNNDPARVLSVPGSDSVRIEYRLLVDRNAPDTIGELELKAKITSVSVADWKFNITVDNTLKDADINAIYVSAKPTPYPGGAFNLSVDVVNANKGTAYYVLARAESPAAFVERNEVFIGTLEPNDYDNIDFEVRVKPGTAPGVYPMNVTFVYRDKDSNLFTDNKKVDFRVASEGDAPSSASIPVWMYAINIVVLLVVIRLAIPFGKWFIKPFRRKRKTEK